MESAARNLELQLKEAEEKAKSLVSEKWQKKVASLEADKDELTQAHDSATEQRQLLEEKMVLVQNQLSDAENALATAKKSLEEREGTYHSCVLLVSNVVHLFGST